ncbi:hypothetical protein IJT10_05615, partial [bacterium]|nr:hypothetical protein [bacterium]
MRKTLNFCLFLVIVFLIGMNSWAEESKNMEAPKEKYPVCGIKMGGEVHPGDDMQIVFSVVGPPDDILPMRVKDKDADSDYIHFMYRNRFMININKKNIVQSITTIGNNVETVNVPFKIGQSKKDVISQWGEPERDTNGM